jgi:hypothetical protein
MKVEFQSGPWLVEYSPQDGARLNRLCFDGYDLLTPEPKLFHPPSTDYGEYETRPVYAYDDCFPSVDSCIYPEIDWQIPDHGELCWLDWEISAKPNYLIFYVKSKALPLLFRREMHFNESGIIWKFEVINEGNKKLPFQHVMHPLINLWEIAEIELPEFDSVYDKISERTMDLKDPTAVKNFLFSQVLGSTNMLFLQKVKLGKMSWTYKNDLHLEVTFPEKYFPTVGIWWNNSAYPDEDGCRRIECAFEPIPGSNSVLIDAYQAGNCLWVEPRKPFSWEIHWNVKR